MSIAALFLSGCGGQTVSATIGGTVVGLSGNTNVTLYNNGSDLINVGANGSFNFDAQINSGSGYNVTIGTQPVGEICTVINGSGVVDSNGDTVTGIVVSCVTTE
jgi:hypothetical protein